MVTIDTNCCNSYFRSPEKLISSFPTLKLRSLTQKISNPRWVVPVLPEQELEVLLNAAIQLTAAGMYCLNVVFIFELTIDITYYIYNYLFYFYIRCGS